MAGLIEPPGVFGLIGLTPPGVAGFTPLGAIPPAVGGFTEPGVVPPVGPPGPAVPGPVACPQALKATKVAKERVIDNSVVFIVMPFGKCAFWDACFSTINQPRFGAPLN